jgi:hypothetical protein
MGRGKLIFIPMGESAGRRLIFGILTIIKSGSNIIKMEAINCEVVKKCSNPIELVKMRGVKGAVCPAWKVPKPLFDFHE